MHPSSLTNMWKARRHTGVTLGRAIRILDVGGRGLSADDDRSYRSVFHDIAKEYCVADITAGHGVTHVMPCPYTLPFPDNHFDLIVSGQTLEHVKNPFRSVAEMMRALKPGGHIILTAPSTGPRHDVIDCWRFMDDAFMAIAEESNIKVIGDWIDFTAPDRRSRKWADHFFVGQKPDPPPSTIADNETWFAINRERLATERAKAKTRWRIKQGVVYLVAMVLVFCLGLLIGVTF